MAKKIIILENTFYTVLSLRMEILYHFKNRGDTVFIVSTGPHSDKEKLEQLGFQSIDVGSVVLNPFKALSYLISLLKTLRRISPDIIFSFTIRPNIFGSMVARILHIPIVSNVTGTGPLITDKSLLYAIIRWMYRFAFTKNQRIFFQNKDDFDYFLAHQYVRKEQAILLPGSGVDTTHYKPYPKNTTHLFTFLMISRLIRDKGVMEYLMAAEMVKKEMPEIQFQLLGPFWTQSTSKNTITREEISSYEHQNIIEYLGYADDVRPYIAASDCVVLPSYREGCANVLMQGASMGKPLIASNVTGCQNLIDHEQTGLICEVKNRKDLALKMIQMIHFSDEKRQEMGKKGREKMEREYPKSKVLIAYQTELEK